MKIGRTGKKLDEEFHTGGSLGLPFPGTYEQEYDMFKSKGPRRITTNEALDSSYPYEFKNNAYYFITDSGNDYKVILNGTKSVEVSFVWRGENNQPKDDISGTGDSRKVFGTVIKIVKDYAEQNNPKEIYFLADNNEPSRIKLYSAFANRAAQVLPNYQSLSPLSNGATTEFVLQRKDLGRVEKATNNAKRLSRKALDKVFENKS